MKLLYRKYYALVVSLLLTFTLNAQDPNRFTKQVEELVQKEYQFDSAKKKIVFAGSSSIRMWKDVQSYFPGYHVINNGFGGSHFSDLLHFYDPLIVKSAPEILFIYEGDNDIASHKKPGKVLKQAKELTAKLQKDLPETRIIYISPKPSIARDSLKNEYIRLNKKLNKHCRRENMEFANVWTAMLDENGNVKQDIFLDDGLHMNKKGYDIWAGVISGILEK
jgi:lysophospholipase L1-like esterase